MTDLRDARLRRALDSAPDADERPGDAVRAAVRDAAKKAVAAPPARRPWWRTLWAEPSNRMPWNAAFATVLVAVLIALVWQDKEVPGARPEAGRADPPMPAREVASVPAPAPRAPAAPAMAPAPQAAPAPAGLRAAVPPPPAAKNEAPVQAQPAAAPEEKKAAAPLLRKSTAEDSSRLRDLGGLASDAAGRAAGETAATAPPPAPMAAPAAPPPPAPAMEARRELSAQARSQPADARLAESMQLHRGGRSASVTRGEAAALARAVDQAIGAADGNEALAAPAQVRIETARGTLEISGDQVRWTPRGRPPLTGRPDPAVLRALGDEVDRLLR